MRKLNTAGTGKVMLLILLTTMSFISMAQRPGGRPGGSGDFFNFTGQLMDENSAEPLEFATVSVFNPSDSSLVKGTVTDAEGKFKMLIRPGTYYAELQFITHQKKIIDNIEIQRGSPVALGVVEMKQQQLELDELVVTGERTQMELTLDKKVYNIGKDLSNLGGSASDLLGNLPSVEVDVEGNISLRGSENVQILIDGKPSGLIGLSGTGGLQQLQGNLIERVEIITNPSARYDAEGGAGIINIILKKDKAKGFNGSFQVQAGYPARNGASVNVNYRTGWINWFVNYGITRRKSPGQGFTNNAFFRPDTTYFINQINNRNRNGLSQNVRFGSDIYFNKKNVLTLSASYRTSDNENVTKTNYDFLDENGILFSDRFRQDNENEDDVNWQYEVLFNRDFKRKGHKLTFNLQYQDSNEVEISQFDDQTNFADGTIFDFNQRAENDNGEERTLIQVDYVQPFSKAAKFEAGIRYNFRNIFNDYVVESDSLDTGIYEEVTALTNDFNFDERILASYLILSNKLDKISWQLGARLEHTDLETLLEQTGESNNQDYLSFFPSANVTYKYSEISSLQMSYSRRVSRPRFRSLNPFVTFSNPLSIYTGNPNLQPQFTDSYELGILQNRTASTIYLGVYHRHTEDVVSRIQIAGEEEGQTIRRPENLAVRNDLGLELNLTQELGSKFRMTGNVNFFNSNTNGFNPETGEDISAEATTVSTRMMGFYRNDKLFNAQMTWSYRAPRRTPQGTRKAITSIDLGLSRDVLKRNGTVALSVRDLFNTRKFRGETITEFFTTDSEFQWRRGPSATVSFTYRLNQRKQRGRRGGRDGGEDFGGGEEGGFSD